MIESLIDFLRILTTPERLLALLTTVFAGWWGYALFFLPGDSLLFTVGVVAGAGGLNIITINIALMVAAIVGDAVGYMLGRHTGARIFDRPNSRFFKREHLIRTQQFYEKHGGKTIIYARFIPIIRTFAPFVAGVAGMSYPRFLSFNIFGGIGWVLSLTMLGYWLGNVPLIRAHFEKVILTIIFVSVLPVVFELIKSARTKPVRTGPSAAD
jgi:membrane-associated protein